MLSMCEFLSSVTSSTTKTKVVLLPTYSKNAPSFLEWLALIYVIFFFLTEGNGKKNYVLYEVSC
jgi:hypothetical protein